MVNFGNLVIKELSEKNVFNAKKFGHLEPIIKLIKEFADTAGNKPESFAPVDMYVVLLDLRSVEIILNSADNLGTYWTCSIVDLLLQRQGGSRSRSTTDHFRNCNR